MLELLGADQIADLQTVYELGRDRLVSEAYEPVLASNKASQQARGDLGLGVNDLVSKTNLVTALADGARRLGRPALARRIRESRPDLFAG